MKGKCIMDTIRINIVADFDNAAFLGFTDNEKTAWLFSAWTRAYRKNCEPPVSLKDDNGNTVAKVVYKE
jgi:hypothetical protein